MRIKLAVRRQKVIELLAQGYSQMEIAEKLGVHRNTIGRDIEALGEQLSRDLEKGPLRQLVKFMALTNNALRRLVRLYDEAGTVREKKEILREIREAGEQQIKVMQSLGLIAKAPEKVEHSGGVNIQIVKTVIQDDDAVTDKED